MLHLQPDLLAPHMHDIIEYMLESTQVRVIGGRREECDGQVLLHLRGGYDLFCPCATLQQQWGHHAEHVCGVVLAGLDGKEGS